jgi:lipopolysaccharide assembly outer membrane protein LptD (OstA)
VYPLKVCLTKSIWIGSLILLSLCSLWSAEVTEQLRLIHSDKLFLSKIQEEQVMELNGKVHFWYGDTEFFCNRALIFDLQKIARLDGKVNVSNDSLSINADSLTYYRIAGDLNAGGKVYITENRKKGPFRWFRSEYMIYNQNKDNLTVWRNVSAYDKEENATANCGYAFWDRKLGYAYMIESPVMHVAKDDTLDIRADKMEYFEEDKKLIATFNVQAMSKDYQTKSDFLIYSLQEDKAIFTGQPKFISEYADAEAKEFSLYFKDRELQRAELADSCRVLFSGQKSKARDNWVRAKYISIDFSEGNITSFRAETSVNYDYTQEEIADKDYFFNSGEGEFLEAMFTPDNKLELMQMRKNIKGTYRFHNKP